MTTYKRVLLTREEKIVIKKMARIQLKSLNEVKATCYSPEVVLSLIEENVEMAGFEGSLDRDIKVFSELLTNPREFFNMRECNINLGKHIMFNFLSSTKYEKGRKAVWKKLLIMDTLPICLQ